MKEMYLQKKTKIRSFVRLRLRVTFCELLYALLLKHLDLRRTITSYQERFEYRWYGVLIWDINSFFGSKRDIIDLWIRVILRIY